MPVAIPFCIVILVNNFAFPCFIFPFDDKFYDKRDECNKGQEKNDTDNS